MAEFSPAELPFPAGLEDAAGGVFTEKETLNAVIELSEILVLCAMEMTKK